MNANEFFRKITSLYGDFATEGMAKEFFSILSKYTDTQRDALMKYYLRTVPGIYKPDVKILLDCVEGLNLKIETQGSKCVCCGSLLKFTDENSCQTCGYNSKYNLDEYKKILEKNKDDAAKIIGNILLNLNKKRG